MLAGRAMVGGFVGADVAESPPDLLFFAGGGGSVRGYAYSSIGVETFELPRRATWSSGGRGLIEGSAEVRYRFSEQLRRGRLRRLGLVARNSNFTGDSDIRSGAGLGVRYFTGIGVAPGRPRHPAQPAPDDDSAVALYIGIGQAF